MTVRIQYKNVNKRELVFTDGRFVKYDQLPLDHMKLFNKELTLTDNALFYQSTQIGTIVDHNITWYNNQIFKFPIESKS